MRPILRRIGSPPACSKGDVPRRIGRTKPDALQVELQAAVLCVAVAHAETERMGRREERDLGTAAERVAQCQRVMCGELADQPVGTGLEALILFRLGDGRGFVGVFSVADVARRSRPVTVTRTLAGIGLRL